jgi:hypothetical protein
MSTAVHGHQVALLEINFGQSFSTGSSSFFTRGTLLLDHALICAPGFLIYS